MPETGGQGVDEWYAEIEEERARVARQLDYPASNEEEIELRTSRANRTADSLSSIIGIYDDADEDDYIDQLPKNKSSIGGSSSSSSSESESDEKEKKGHLTAELHDDDQGFIHMDTGIQYDGEGRLGTAGHETYSEAHLNPDAVEDYHHSDNRHDSSSVDLIHSVSLPTNAFNKVYNWFIHSYCIRLFVGFMQRFWRDLFRQSCLLQSVLQLDKRIHVLFSAT